MHPPSLDACFEHTDLRWRLEQIPDSATSRGVFFNMLDERAADLGRGVQHAYREFFQLYRFSTLRMFPVRDYLTRIVVLAQIAFGADDIYVGIRRIQRTAFASFAGTLVGRTMLALIDRDPVAILKVIESGYATRTMASYPSLKVSKTNGSGVELTFENEYVYIEHAMAGAIEGVLDACGVSGQIEVDLATPFSGVMRVRMDRP